MIHLFSPAPALDLDVETRPPRSGKIGLLRAWSVSPGGKAVNVARFLGAWGVPNRLALGAGGGTDPTHALYGALLRREGIPATYVDGDSPIRLNLFARTGAFSAKYNHPGHPLSARALAVFERGNLARLRKGDDWVFTGRVPKGIAPGTIRRWVRNLENRGVRCLLDTSGEALKSVLDSRASFYKVNLHEMNGALGRRYPGLESLVPVLPSLQRRGMVRGAVTDGSRGVLAWDGPEVVLARPPRLKRARPLVVGAGDAFLAGYLKAWREGKHLADRVRWACAAGAAVAENGIEGFDPRRVKRLLRAVKFV